MSIKKNLLIFLFVIAVFVSAIFLYNNNQIKEIGGEPFLNIGGWESVFAGTCSSGSHNMTGWAYSDVIGPISLNCGNCDGTNCVQGYDYGVNIDSNRNLSGYAWNSGIGPISFNANEICANGNCTGAFPEASAVDSDYSAKVVYVSDGTAKIKGWARALAACDFNGTTCTKNGAGDNAGGWDGWIKFDGSTTATFVDGGLPYNTIIKTVGSEYQVQGNAWGGVLDTNTPPSAVLGEIRFLPSAKTTYNPNNACPSQTPVAAFTITCKKLSGTVCYFNVGSGITLVNQSTDADEATCSLSNDIETSLWTPGGTVAGDGNSSFLPSTSSTNYTQSISLKVTDYLGLNNTLTKSYTMRRAIVTNFSCCIKDKNGGGDCSTAATFKNCNDSGFAGLTVNEGTILHLKDNTSLTTAHTVPAYSTTISNRSWSYNGGDITGSGEDVSIPITKDATITLSATDTSLLTDTESKLLSDGAGGMFSKIIPNPDFIEIPFD
ncbi:MAG: hypothetical protein PHG24_02555 [Candidatus Pacebacteria bacterium]|nr:hypothetical protein [Candidatus Paceibacterota bacterium]